MANRPEEQAKYDVVWPLGKEMQEDIDFSTRVADLNGKVIAELQDLEHGQWFPAIRQELKRRYPGVTIVGAETFGWTHGPHERQVIADLPDKLKEFGVDAVISGVGL